MKLSDERIEMLKVLRSLEIRRDIAAALAELDVLAEMTGYARNRRFRYEPYVRLFTDEVPEGGAA